jgi:hypothetical protein
MDLFGTVCGTQLMPSKCSFLFVDLPAIWKYILLQHHYRITYTHGNCRRCCQSPALSLWIFSISWGPLTASSPICISVPEGFSRARRLLCLFWAVAQKCWKISKVPGIVFSGWLMRWSHKHPSSLASQRDEYERFALFSFPVAYLNWI